MVRIGTGGTGTLVLSSALLFMLASCSRQRCCSNEAGFHLPLYAVAEVVLVNSSITPANTVQSSKGIVNTCNKNKYKELVMDNNNQDHMDLAAILGLSLSLSRSPRPCASMRKYVQCS